MADPDIRITIRIRIQYNISISLQARFEKIAFLNRACPFPEEITSLEGMVCDSDADFTFHVFLPEFE